MQETPTGALIIIQKNNKTKCNNNNGAYNSIHNRNKKIIIIAIVLNDIILWGSSLALEMCFNSMAVSCCTLLSHAKFEKKLLAVWLHHQRHEKIDKATCQFTSARACPNSTPYEA